MWVTQTLGSLSLSLFVCFMLIICDIDKSSVLNSDSSKPTSLILFIWSTLFSYIHSFTRFICIRNSRQRTLIKCHWLTWSRCLLLLVARICSLEVPGKFEQQQPPSPETSDIRGRDSLSPGSPHSEVCALRFVPVLTGTEGSESVRGNYHNAPTNISS